jgi:hypothetical protein
MLKMKRVQKYNKNQLCKPCIKYRDLFRVLLLFSLCIIRFMTSSANTRLEIYFDKANWSFTSFSLVFTSVKKYNIRKYDAQFRLI